MAKKANHNAKQQIESIADELAKKLSTLGEIKQRKMFGGVGIFHGGKMFAMVSSKATPYLKTNSESEGKFEALGAERFHTLRYHEIPDSVFSDARKLRTWAQASIDLALSK